MNRREALRYTAYVTGFAVSAPFASALLSGCTADSTAAATGAAAYEPAFFSADEYRFIQQMSDVIIPRTDTPGANDVGVPELIDQVVGNIYKPEEREKYQKGLQRLMAKVQSDQKEGNTFADLDDAGRLAYAQDIDGRYKQPRGEDAPEMSMDEQQETGSWFDLKSQIISGYFGSQEVAMNQLAYLPVPGEYVPCGDLQELTGGKAWAL